MVLGHETVIEPPVRAIVTCIGLPTTIKPASTELFPDTVAITVQI